MGFYRDYFEKIKWKRNGNCYICRFLLSSFWIECMLTNRGTVLLGLAAQGGKSG